MAKKKCMNEEIIGITKTITNSSKPLHKFDVKLYAEYETGWAHIIAKNTKELNTHQLRKFFSKVKEIEYKTQSHSQEADAWNQIEGEFIFLKPQLASSVGRGHMDICFFDFLMAIMDKVEDSDNPEENYENFKTFVKFFEAIVAYKKYEELDSKK